MTTTEKTCFKCGLVKPMSEFYKHHAMSDGHLNKCKECAKMDAFNRRHGSGRSKVLEYDRIRSKQPQRMLKAGAIQARWRKEHPDRRAAHYALRSAVFSGKVTPLPCLVCGGKAEAHHPDYSDPLFPVWLCPSHHKQAHALAAKLLKNTTHNN